MPLKGLAIALAVFGLGAAIVVAFYWWKASTPPKSNRPWVDRRLARVCREPPRVPRWKGLVERLTAKFPAFAKAFAAHRNAGLQETYITQIA